MDQIHLLSVISNQEQSFQVVLLVQIHGFMVVLMVQLFLVTQTPTDSLLAHLAQAIIIIATKQTWTTNIETVSQLAIRM